MLTKKQLNALNETLANVDVKGKGSIQKVIWMNTIKPTYKVGDNVIFSSDRKSGLIMYGTRVIKFIGTITEIDYAWPSKVLLYEIEFRLSNGETKKMWFEESNISRKTTAKNLINKVGDGETSFMLEF